MKRLLSIIVLVAMSVGSTAFADSPAREFRGVWFTTVFGIDWPSQQGTSSRVVQQQQREIDAYLDRFKAVGLNTVCFQVRSMADAMYMSSLEPFSSFASGRRGDVPSWDPLLYVVKGCHDRGLECYAWVNPFRWSKGTDYNTPFDRRLKEKGWLLSHKDYTVLNPGLADVRRHIVDVCREIVEGYGIDGLLFDDYFYPNDIPEDSTAADFGLWKSQSSLPIGDWRRANVNSLVADVAAMIATTRPDVRFGIGPAGVAGKEDTSAPVYDIEPCPVKASDWQYRSIYSDPIAWLESGTVDFISPQLYWPTTHATAPYAPLSAWWSGAASHYDRHHYASQSLSRLEKDSSEVNRREIVTQIELNRSHTLNEAPGCCFFSARQLRGTLGDELAAGVFDRPALQPVLAWKKAPHYDPVKKLHLDGDLLSWRPVEPAAGQSIVKYTVYALPADYHVKKNKPLPVEYLLDVTYNPFFNVPSHVVEGDYRIAVCVYDGYGNEHRPALIDHK